MSKFYKLNITGNNEDEIETATEIALTGFSDALDTYPSLKEKELTEIKEYLPDEAWIWLHYHNNPLYIIEYALNRKKFPDWLPLLPEIIGDDREKSLAADLRKVSLWEFHENYDNASHKNIVKIIDFLPKKSKTWLENGFSINHGIYLIKKSISYYKKQKSKKKN